MQGYEKTAFPDNFFDVAIGNVPFGQFHVADKRYDRLNFPIHEYFIAKALDQVRPGGVIAVVTSSYTMDKRTASAKIHRAASGTAGGDSATQQCVQGRGGHGGGFRHSVFAKA